ncbi:hypothetical protein LIER_06212 [Lithospermum erythrorhizon]|uniref:Uncharacterized protein n=1 Tax=Lithospermum erythrorhizon TaxID=34254 RepID=A0AAV3P584_LITER
MLPEYGSAMTDSYSPSVMPIAMNDMDIYVKAFPNNLTGAALDCKLKKVLVLDIPLTKDELTKMVNKHIDLENLQRKEGLSSDIQEKLSRKDNQGQSKWP